MLTTPRDQPWLIGDDDLRRFDSEPDDAAGQMHAAAIAVLRVRVADVSIRPVRRRTDAAGTARAARTARLGLVPVRHTLAVRAFLDDLPHQPTRALCIVDTEAVIDFENDCLGGIAHPHQFA